MGKLTDEDVDGLEELVRKSAPALPRSIGASIKSAGAYRSLLKAVAVKAVPISKQARELRLEEPSYLRRIDVFADDLEKLLKGLSVEITKIDGSVVALKAVKASVTKADGTSTPCVRLDAKAVCVSVAIKSLVPYTALRVTRFDVIGYTFDQLEAIAAKVATTNDTLNRLDAYVAEKKGAAKEADERRKESEATLQGLIQQAASASAELASARSELSSVQELIGEEKSARDGLSSQIDSARGAFESLRNNHAQLEQDVKTLNQEVSNKRSELQALVNDRSLISDEYRDYVAEGKQQSKVYEWFLYFSMAIIALCAWQLYSGAARILEADVGGYEELLTLVLQRAPFAAAIAFVVTVAWKLGSLFVSRIMTIHAQRLALARLLVIAKDTVYSSAAGLPISDEQKFRERIRLKLAMLRAHLTSELGADFVFDSRSEDEQPDADARREHAIATDGPAEEDSESRDSA